MRGVNRITTSFLCAFGLSACGMMPAEDSSQANIIAPQPELVNEEKSFIPPSDCGGDLTSEQRMYLELVYKMEAQGQYHAALAHIDELEKKAESPQTFYLRAEALRQLGQIEGAAKYYQLLLGGCMTGYGLHGLGLLAIQAGQLAEAESYLKHACRERPIDSNTHNDYGMALLLRGRYEVAKNEFMTALQLDRNNRLPIENLIVLMLIEQRQIEARQFAERQGLKEQDLKRLMLRAQQLKGNAQPTNNPQTSVSRETASQAADNNPLQSNENSTKIVTQQPRENLNAENTAQILTEPRSLNDAEAAAPLSADVKLSTEGVSQDSGNPPADPPRQLGGNSEATVDPQLTDEKSPAEGIQQSSGNPQVEAAPQIGDNFVAPTPQPTEVKLPTEDVAQSSDNPPAEAAPQFGGNSEAMIRAEGKMPTEQELQNEDDLQLDENYEPVELQTADDNPQNQGSTKSDVDLPPDVSHGAESGLEAKINSAADGKRQTNDNH